jgi:hypothetical protein
MANKDTDPFGFSEGARIALEQTHQAMDTYFDFLKKSISAIPSSGTEIGDSWKAQSLLNLTAFQELADWGKSVDWVAMLVESRPFDPRNALGLCPRRFEFDHLSFEVELVARTNRHRAASPHLMATLTAVADSAVEPTRSENMTVT